MQADPSSLQDYQTVIGRIELLTKLVEKQDRLFAQGYYINTEVTKLRSLIKTLIALGVAGYVYSKTDPQSILQGKMKDLMNYFVEKSQLPVPDESKEIFKKNDFTFLQHDNESLYKAIKGGYALSAYIGMRATLWLLSY